MPLVLNAGNNIIQKISWIDNLKAIGILMVILGHINSPFSHFIFSWHMPLFFIVAGFFIKFDLSVKDFLIKDFKRLMVPYFVFAIVGLVVETAKRMALHRDVLDYIYEITGIFIWMDMPSLINTYAFVLWFLPTLFFARIIIFLVNKQFASFLLRFILIFSLFLVSFVVNIPFGIDNAMNAVLFVFIGSIFFRFYQDDKKLYGFAFGAMAAILYFGIPSLDMANKNYENVFINILWSASIVFVIVAALKKIDFKSKSLNVWGKSTMLLFIMHPYTNNIAHIVVEKLHFGDWWLKLFISLTLLQMLILAKQKFAGKMLFKYV
ncbi:MAG TPA: acyltransferase family protein [Campylobacterales bacterium]|nr:acyltransferase family protein [Campylobacterales bacterium]